MIPLHSPSTLTLAVWRTARPAESAGQANPGRQAAYAMEDGLSQLVYIQNSGFQ
jgi:hypothetical protein